jgi:hypothetical protein
MHLADRIRSKWLNDCCALPLSPGHWELYEIIHVACWRKLSEFPELVLCRDLNDRINWLKLFDQRIEAINCSDKIAVRDHVRERVGSHYLVDLFQAQEHFSQIDFARLPSAFVIKTNHDSGTVILVPDKSKLDVASAEARIESALNRPFGWRSGEWPYRYIQPRVLVEGYIGVEKFRPPPDYKFQCVDGRVVFCRCIFGRGIDAHEAVTDRDGQEMGFVIQEAHRKLNDVVRPPQWEEMIYVAEALSKGFKCVRVDLLLNNDRIYAGEMTFFPHAGVYKGEGQKRVGHLLNFDRTTVRPLLLQDLEKKVSPLDLYHFTRIGRRWSWANWRHRARSSLNRISTGPRLTLWTSEGDPE